MHLNSKIRRALARVALDEARFRAAVAEASAAVGDAAPPAQRVLLSAAVCYQPGARHADLGGGVSLYPLILKMLGLDVEVVDNFSGGDGGEDNLAADEFARRKAAIEAAGVRLTSADLYDVRLEPGAYDGVSMFETIEHLPHSPKPILKMLAAALKPGGRFCLSVPNINRIENRFRMLGGKNPLGKYAYFYHHGNPFLGHHRETNLAEVAWLPGQLGLVTEDLFATDLRYKEMAGGSLKARLARLSDTHLTTDKITPPAFRRQIFLVARKPA